MKQIKKIVWVTMFASLLTACDPGNKPDQNTQASGVVASSESAIVQQPLDLRTTEVSLLKKAEEGVAQDQFALGRFYELNKRDYLNALKWYEKAAKQGYASAQVKMGNHHASWYPMGYVGAYDFEFLTANRQENKKKALDWYEKAAAQNNAEALFRLAQEKESSEDVAGTKERYQKALKAIEQAAQSDENVELLLAQLYLSGLAFYSDKGEVVILKSDLSKGQKILKKLADKNNLEAMSILAYSYQAIGDEDGLVNFQQAVSYYKKAADQNYIPAILALGEIYWLSTNARLENEKRAVEYYEKASMLGSVYADYSLGRHYLGWGNEGECEGTGSSTLTNRGKGLDYLKKAAEKGSVDAAKLLGNFYQYDSEREGVADLKQAKAWFNKAAELGADISAELQNIKEQEAEKKRASETKVPVVSSEPVAPSPAKIEESNTTQE